MTTLHEAARLVVAAWTSTRRTWVEECNYAVLALDAALKAQAGCDTETDCTSQPWCRISGECHRKQAQPEPAQEPSESSCDECGKSKADGWALYCVECLEQFFHPTEPAQEAEPYAWHYTNKAGASVWHRGPSTRLDADMQGARDYPRVHKVTPLYTGPLQRPPLTDEEISDIYIDWDITPGRRIADLVRAVERKVRGE